VRIEADSILPYSRDVVFRAYRDDLPKVVEFLPNVRAIEVKKRDEAGPITTLFNVWHGGGEVPAAARALLDDLERDDPPVRLDDPHARVHRRGDVEGSDQAHRARAGSHAHRAAW
jgi:hypothetical protein